MRNLKRQFLAGPYILWMAGFILLPTLMILYYAFTSTSGDISLLNVTSITFSVHFKSLMLSLKLALICTVICLILSYPLAMILNNLKTKSQGLVVFIFILPISCSASSHGGCFYPTTASSTQRLVSLDCQDLIF